MVLYACFQWKVCEIVCELGQKFHSIWCNIWKILKNSRCYGKHQVYVSSLLVWKYGIQWTSLTHCGSLTSTGLAGWSAQMSLCPVDANILLITNLQEVPVFTTRMHADDVFSACSCLLTAILTFQTDFGCSFWPSFVMTSRWCMWGLLIVQNLLCVIMADTLYSSELYRLLLESGMTAYWFWVDKGDGLWILGSDI